MSNLHVILTCCSEAQTHLACTTVLCCFAVLCSFRELFSYFSYGSFIRNRASSSLLLAAASLTGRSTWKPHSCCKVWRERNGYKYFLVINCLPLILHLPLSSHTSINYILESLCHIHILASLCI